MQHAVIAVVTVREAPDHLVQGHFIPRFHIYAGQVRVSGQVVTVADYDGIVESLHEDNLGDIALEYRTYFRAASRSDIDALVVYHQTFLCGVRMDAVAVYDHASADGIGSRPLFWSNRPDRFAMYSSCAADFGVARFLRASSAIIA